MKILHTSDWHLGKKLFKLDRSEEHARFLRWLVMILSQQKIDLLLIAGDIFDTPTPPHQSLEMFYEFLHRVSTETSTETFIIAGNHDSGLLLEAPSKLLAPHRVKVWGKLSPEANDHWVKITKDQETLEICALPFFRSYELLPQGEGDALLALKKYLTRETHSPKLLMLHHLAGMFEAAGSEQVISLSGVDSIPTELLNDFDYVALGHIHKPQRIGKNAQYSGSPLPMRFSETQAKSVVIIEQALGKLTTQILPIPVFRDLCVLKATPENWKDKIAKLEMTSDLTPQVEVQLTMDAPQMGLIEEIKKALTDKGCELLSFLPFYSGEEKTEKKHERLFELTPVELFTEFYAMKFPDAPEIPEELKADFTALLEKVKHAPRTS